MAPSPATKPKTSGTASEGPLHEPKPEPVVSAKPPAVSKAPAKSGGLFDGNQSDDDLFAAPSARKAPSPAAKPKSSGEPKSDSVVAKSDPLSKAPEPAGGLFGGGDSDDDMFAAPTKPMGKGEVPTSTKPESSDTAAATTAGAASSSANTKIKSLQASLGGFNPLALKPGAAPPSKEEVPVAASFDEPAQAKVLSSATKTRARGPSRRPPKRQASRPTPENDELEKSLGVGSVGSASSPTAASTLPPAVGDALFDSEDSLFGNPTATVPAAAAARAPVKKAIEPEDDLFGVAPSAPAPSATTATEPTDDLFDVTSSVRAPKEKAGESVDDLFDAKPTPAPSAKKAAAPSDDLFNATPPAPSTATQSAVPESSALAEDEPVAKKKTKKKTTTTKKKKKVSAAAAAADDIFDTGIASIFDNPAASAPVAAPAPVRKSAEPVDDLFDDVPVASATASQPTEAALPGPVEEEEAAPKKKSKKKTAEKKKKKGSAAAAAADIFDTGGSIFDDPSAGAAAVDDIFS